MGNILKSRKKEKIILIILKEEIQINQSKNMKNIAKNLNLFKEMKLLLKKMKNLLKNLQLIIQFHRNFKPACRM